MAKQEIFKDDGGGWRYRIRAANGEILVSSESYTREPDAQRGLDTLKEALAKLNEVGTDESTAD